MYKTCQRAFVASDIASTKRLEWNTYIPDQREDVVTQTADQLDPGGKPWFKPRSTYVYQFPSVVLVEEVFPRGDVPTINSNDTKKATEDHQRQEDTQVESTKIKKLTSKTYQKDLKALYKRNRPETDERQSAKKRKAVSFGQKQSGVWNRARKVEGESILATHKDQSLDRGTDPAVTKKNKDDGGKGAYARVSEQKHPGDVTKDGTGQSVTSEGGRERQASRTKPPGVLRRLELNAEGFFEFLFSDRWHENCVVRVLTGGLLNNMLHCLTKLERFHDIISYTTIAYFYNKKPLLPCIKTASDKKDYELVEERVLVELDCYYPQERPEVITERLWATGSLCFPNDEVVTCPRVIEEPPLISDFPKGSIIDGHVSAHDHRLSEKELQPPPRLKSFSHYHPHRASVKLPGKSDSAHGGIVKPPDKSDSAYGGIVKPPDKSDSAYGGRVKPPDKSDSAHGGRVKPPDKSDSAHGGIVKPPDKSDSAHGGIVKPPDKSDSAHGGAVKSQDKSDSVLSNEETPPDESSNMGTGKPGETIRSMSTGGETPPDKPGETSRDMSTGGETPPDKPGETSRSMSTGGETPPDKPGETSRDMSTGGETPPDKPGETSRSMNTGGETPPDKPGNMGSDEGKAPDQTNSLNSDAEKPPQDPNNVRTTVKQPPDPLNTSTGTEKLPSIPQDIVTSASEHSAKVSWNGVPTLPPIRVHSIPSVDSDMSTTAHDTTSSTIKTLRDTSYESRPQDSFHDDRSFSGWDASIQDRSCSGVALPVIKCNIRGLTRPRPPHNSCLRQFHMVREPFWKRRVRQQTAFPRIGLPELPIDITTRTDEQTELEDEKHLGIVLEDESELVASTTSLQTYPSPPVREMEVASCSDHRASKFFKEMRIENQEIKDKVKDSASVESLSTDSSGDAMEEDELPSCPEPGRRNNFLKDIEMMREEFLVKPTLPKSAKDDIQKRLKQAVVGKIPPIQLTQVKKDIKRGMAKEKLAKKYALSPFSTPTPRGTSVGSTDVSTLPPLSYKNVNVLDNPFGFLKRWDKTPNFYEFCLYLVGTEGKSKRTKTDIRGGVKHGAAGHKLPMQSSDATGTSESKFAHKKSRKNLKEKKKTLRDAPPGEGNTTLESLDDNRKTVKQKGMQEALVELHAHTRIQIAAEERRLKSGNLPKTKAMAKKGADVQSVETMLKQAALGITVSGTHLLSDEQEKLLEDEEYILSSIDPWHVSVAFAYLAGGVCDSVGVRDYLLRRRKQILNIIENSKQTVKVNEARVRCALKNAHDKTLGKTPKAMEEAIFEELKEQGKSRLGKEKDKKSKKGREHTEEDFEERKTQHGKIEIIADLENEEDGKLHQESDQDVRLKKSPSNKGKHETTTESDTTKSGKKDKKRSGKKGRKRKPAGYVYIEDSKIPDKISPNRLFRIMRLNEIFDPQKLHSAYSFEKLYSHRKSYIPHYGNLLSMFEKPFKQTKKKKKPETHAKHKTKGAKKAEEIMEKTPVKEISPPFVLGKLRDFKFLQYRNHQPEPMKTEVKTPKEMSADEICRNMILAMQMFVVRKERATTVYGTCQYKSKVSVTFTKKSEEEAWMGVPPQVDCQWLVTAVCKTLSKTF